MIIVAICGAFCFFFFVWEVATERGVPPRNVIT